MLAIVPAIFFTSFIMDKFLPIWIIGAPLVLAIIDWMRTPKPTLTHPH